MPARLAWSVHAADDALRKALVPSAKFPVAELRDAFADALGVGHIPGGRSLGGSPELGSELGSGLSSGRSSRSSGLADSRSSHRGRKSSSLLVECTLIDGINDGPEHADALLRLLRPLPAVRVNLIPFNASAAGVLRGTGATFRSSPPERVEAFRQRIVQAGGHLCTTRPQRGAEADAACGMLAEGRRERRNERHQQARALGGMCRAGMPGTAPGRARAEEPS